MQMKWLIGFGLPRSSDFSPKLSGSSRLWLRS